MSDHGNATTAIASWDEKAVSDMYFTLAEVRGVFTNAEAAEVEQRMRAKGYTFTAKQLQYVVPDLSLSECVMKAELTFS